MGGLARLTCLRGWAGVLGVMEVEWDVARHLARLGSASERGGVSEAEAIEVTFSTPRVVWNTRDITI